MPNTNQAVFLSYAREDSTAARHIAEALRGAGVEVWFDETELRGGDAWDAKIKKLIRDCALFVSGMRCMPCPEYRFKSTDGTCVPRGMRVPPMSEISRAPPNTVLINHRPCGRPVTAARCRRGQWSSHESRGAAPRAHRDGALRSAAIDGGADRGATVDAAWNSSAFWHL